MADRPLYCPPLDENLSCPECGATVEGNDPVQGVCQAIRSGPAPKPLVEIVLIDQKTGKVV